MVLIIKLYHFLELQSVDPEIESYTIFFLKIPIVIYLCVFPV